MTRTAALSVCVLFLAASLPAAAGSEQVQSAFRPPALTPPPASRVPGSPKDWERGDQQSALSRSPSPSLWERPGAHEVGGGGEGRLSARVASKRTNPREPSPRLVLLLQPELTVEAVLGPSSPFHPLLQRAAVGAMNPAVRGPREPASAYLTLGAGLRLAAGPLTQPALFAGETLEGDTAAAVYRRRIGPLRPAVGPDGQHHTPDLIHPLWAAYLNSLDQHRSAGTGTAAGALGEALRERGIAWIGVGPAANRRLGALAALDARGTVPWALAASEVSAPIIRHLLERAALAVVELPPGHPLPAVAAMLSELAADRDLNVLLISPYPPPDQDGAWARLTPLLALGPGFLPGVLTSATTRTHGLVANIDVAPTVLAALNVPTPPGIQGRTFRSAPPVDPHGVTVLAREAEVAHRAVVPMGIGVGATAIVALALSLFALRSRGSSRRRLVPLARGAILVTATAPLASLIAPTIAPSSVPGLALAAGCAALMLPLALGLAPGLRHRPLLSLFALAALVIAGDLCLGGRLIARSPLSSYTVSGIRFYGLGNEYMGFLVGMGLLAPLIVEGKLRRWRALQAAVYLILLLLIGLPSVGANLGGALAAAAAFAAALAVAAWPGQRLRVALSVAAALVVTAAGLFTWAALQPAAGRTHIGEFARVVVAGGWPAALPVLQGKAELAFRILTSDYALVPILGVAPLLGLWYHGAGRWLCALLSKRPELRAATVGAVVGGIAAFTLNDSGVVPWMIITSTTLALLLDEQLRVAP